MKANELRIGNLVEYQIHDELEDPKSFWVENVIDAEDLSYIDKSRNYRPITLTEKWLLKFGFASNPYADRYEKKEIHIECDKTKGETQLWIEGMPHIKHVHQLQNLYFALTGEELAIKEVQP